jgi:hypothetical protein
MRERQSVFKAHWMFLITLTDDLVRTSDDIHKAGYQVHIVCLWHIAEKARWQQYWALERYNPVKPFKGNKFTLATRKRG